MISFHKIIQIKEWYKHKAATILKISRRLPLSLKFIIIPLIIFIPGPAMAIALRTLQSESWQQIQLQKYG
jgi:hypothetical protein